eukprot:gene15280-18077_t
MLEFCQALPKIELHAHLNGSIRNSTIRELAASKGDAVGLAREDILKITEDGDRNLAECFRLFDLIHKVTTEHTTVTRITREVLQDFADDNVIYIEIRTTPKDNAKFGITKQSYLDSVLAGMEGYIHKGEGSKMMVQHCNIPH